MKRDKLDYVQFDVGFFHKPKHKALRYKFGQESLLILASVLCDIGAATNAEIDPDVFYATCYEYDLVDEEEEKGLLEYLVANGILAKTAEGKLTNSRIVEDQESLATKRDLWRDKQRKVRERKENKESVTSDTRGESEETLNTEDLNTEDLNNKIKKEKPKPEVLVFPPKLDNEPCRNAWNSWLEHKKSRGERYKSVQSQQQKLKEWAEKPDEFIEAINFSMGNNWAGIFPKREEKQQTNAPNPQRKLSPTEQSIQAAQRIMQRIENSKIGALDEK